MGEKGHRRVRSLVKEYDDNAMEPEPQRTLTPMTSNSSLRSTSSAGSARSRTLTGEGDRTPRERKTSNNSLRIAIVPEPSTPAIQGDLLEDAAAVAEEERDEFLPLTPVSPFSASIYPSGQTSPAKANGHMNAAERREHSRRHSRIHSRNLSVFFPRPGEQQPWSPNELEQETVLPVLEIPQPTSASGPLSATMPHSASSTSSESPLRASQRRGHHHRHSVSHNFFTFLEPEISPVSSISSRRPSTVPGSALSRSFAASTYLPANPSLGLRARYAHLPWPVRLLIVLILHIPLRTQLYLLLGIAEICLGAALWVYGQAGEGLSVTGLGYLVVFDGIAAVGAVIVEGNAPGIEVLWEVMSGRTERGLRHPYGTYRYVTVNHFAQCVYLLFSAVYVCKESVEHVLLLHGPTEDFATDGHGLAHGGMGHGEALQVGMASSRKAELGDVGIVIPTGILCLSVLACFLSSLAVQNHATLVEAVGHATYALRPRAPLTAQSSSTVFLLSLLSNPFSLATIIFGSGLVVASLTIPSLQLAPLDKVLALLESIAMFYIAYPAAEAIGKVLLQTAPPPDAATMAALTRTLDTMRDQPLISSIAPPHVWQLTPHPPPSAATMAAAKAGGRGLRDMAEEEALASIVVATILIHVRHSATDDEILALTQHARERCTPALGRDGELTVQVVREEKREHVHTHSHSHADHSHHSHSVHHHHHH